MILTSNKKVFPFDQNKPHSEYMMHSMLDLALKYQKPVQIHTGLQVGDGNYIISPSYNERYLHEWLETVPANKIMAF